MASTDNEVPQPIIVKKIKKGGGGHHGGAWKVAYADFVTAMMAFFLLMWLLNVTTENKKTPFPIILTRHTPVSSELSGSGGILGGCPWRRKARSDQCAGYCRAKPPVTAHGYGHGTTTRPWEHPIMGRYI